MSYFYSTITFHERELMILALETTLNNINLFSLAEERILISSNIPSVIQKLTHKELLTGNDFNTLALALAFVHNVLANHENIRVEDKEKIQPHKLTYGGEQTGLDTLVVHTVNDDFE